MITIPREQTEFVTPEGLLSFLYVMPGQAQDSFTAGNKVYKAEIGIPYDSMQSDPQGAKMLAALSLVASVNDTSVFRNPTTGVEEIGWHKHIYGPKGKIRKLEETDRDRSKYPYYEGKYVLSFSAVYTPERLVGKDQDLSDPTVRARYNTALDAKAPGVYRYPDLSVPGDVARVIARSSENVKNGLPAIPEADYYKTYINCLPQEIWSGCWGRIIGRVYWSKNAKPLSPNFALIGVLLTRQGERLVGDTNPDRLLSDFAPPQSLAPPAPLGAVAPPAPPAAPAPAVDPWAALR